VEMMTEATKNVSTGEVTFAVRDTNIDGIAIKKDDILCILNNKIICTKKTPEEGARAIVEAMIKKEPKFLNIYYGEDGKEEQALELQRFVEKTDESIEIEVHEGRQPLYHYIISAE
ncbi:MAG: DAK2 domain-containing protein, partial [Defluviitaleaceae bacterium]|nr:DAK2 domain-containing protein [Defluviitaleaceae bacterium]